MMIALDKRKIFSGSTTPHALPPQKLLHECWRAICLRQLAFFLCFTCLVWRTAAALLQQWIEKFLREFVCHTSLGKFGIDINYVVDSSLFILPMVKLVRHI